MARLKPYYVIQPEEWWLTADPGVAKALQASRSASSPDAKELVRQWALRELVESYHYPRDWLGTRIIAVGPESNGPHGSKLFGFCVLTSGGQPFLWVSVGASGEAEQAEENVKSVLLGGHHAGIGMSTDGSTQGSKFMRRRFDREKCEYVLDLEPYTAPGITPGPQPYLFDTNNKPSGLRRHQTLTPLSERIEDVFFEVHSHIRDIDGLHADEALDELCKTLYVKLYDEEMSGPQAPYRMQRWLYGSTEEVATVIRNLYEEANEYDLRVFSLKIPGYQRSRGVFNTPIRLSSPALARVVETLQDYDIAHSATDVKGRAFQKVLGPSIRAGMGQYFTPYPIIQFMAKAANPAISDLILDPFCGSGHFLTACLQLVRKQAEQDGGSEKSWYEFAFGKLHGIEKSDRMVRIAMTDMRLQGDGHSNIRCTDALLAFSNYPDLQPESFDLILTNPPFGSLLGEAAIAQLGQFSLAEGRKSIPLEVLGIERCMQFLRPGGRLGIILPDGLLANRVSRYVRDWLEGQAKLRAIISLPIETFSLFGASIKTSIVFVRKWRRGERKESDYPVFLARVDNVGYDTTGRSREGPDLDAVAYELMAFLNKEGW